MPSKGKGQKQCQQPQQQQRQQLSDEAVEDDEDYVTVQILSERLEQQRLFFIDMMDRQEKNFKTFLQLFMDSTNKRMDELAKDVSNLRNSLEFTQAEFDNHKRIINDLAVKIKDARNDINVVCESAISMATKNDYLECQSKRNNIIINGIPETKRETWDDTEAKVRKLLAEKLEMDEKKIEVERAHRTGPPAPPEGRHRPIVVKFLKWKDKAAVMARARKLKGTDIYLNEDYSEAVKQKRKELIPLMKKERENGNIAYIRFDKLIVHPPFHSSTPKSK